MSETRDEVKCDKCGNDTFYVKVIEDRGVEVTLRCTKCDEEEIYSGA